MEGEFNGIAISSRWNWGRVVSSWRIVPVSNLLLFRSQLFLCLVQLSFRSLGSAFCIPILRAIVGSTCVRVVVGLGGIFFRHNGELLKIVSALRSSERLGKVNYLEQVNARMSTKKILLSAEGDGVCDETKLMVMYSSPTAESGSGARILIVVLPLIGQ